MRGQTTRGRACLSSFFVFTARSAPVTQEHQRMKSERSFTIRSYRDGDRAAVRRLCCQTGFLGEPIDPVYEDRQLFADFLTTYYTDHEPESCFLLEVEGHIRGYLLGSRKPLRNQLYAFYQTVWLFCAGLPRTSATKKASPRFFRGRLLPAGA